MKHAGKRSTTSGPSRKIRYAVVGLGHIAQNAILPAFAHAGSNSQLVALVSGDKEKLAKLGRKYKTPALYSYEQYDECLGAKRSMPCTSRCRTACTANTPCAPRRLVSMYFVKNRWQ